MEKDEIIPNKRGLYDIEICVGLDELKRTLNIINSCGWLIVGFTQDDEIYTVLFRRPCA